MTLKSYAISATFNKKAHEYKLRMNAMGASVELKPSDQKFVELLTEYIGSKEVGRNTKLLANELGIDEAKFFNYLMAKHDANSDKKLSAEEIANGIIALDKANGLDGKLDITKLEEKPAEEAKKSEADKPEAVWRDRGFRVSPIKENQNASKAKLYKNACGTTESWTDYVIKMAKHSGSANGTIASHEEIKCIFNITDAAAKALFAKAKALNPKNIADGLGQVLKDMDDRYQGGLDKGDGQITIGEFNTYVEELLGKETKEKTEKSEKSEKPEKSNKGGGNSSNKVEINNGADTEALNEQIAELEKEIEALKKEDEPPKEVAPVSEKKGKNRGLLLAGAGLLAAGAAFFAIKDRRDRQRYAQQLNNPPQPFCPPLPPAPLPVYPQPVGFNGQFQGLVQGPFQAQGSQNMFGNVLA